MATGFHLPNMIRLKKSQATLNDRPKTAGENSTYAKDDDAWCRDMKIGRSTQSTLPDHDEMAYFST